MIRESHLTTIPLTTIGTTKVVGTAVQLGWKFGTGDVENGVTIPESKYPTRFHGMKVRVFFPKSYTGTMNIELKSGETSEAMAVISTYTVSSDLTEEYFETVLPDNTGCYASVDITPSAAMASGKLSAEFVANV